MAGITAKGKLFIIHPKLGSQDNAVASQGIIARWNGIRPAMASAKPI